jgi:hypothetical protein
MAQNRAFGIVIFLFAVLAVAWITRTQIKFQHAVRASGGSDVVRFVVCDLPCPHPTIPCRIILRDSPTFSEINNRLMNATATLAPGKVPITVERLLKVESESSRGQPSHQCFRVVEYEGFPNSYLNQIVANSDCTDIEKYAGGYVALAGMKWP